MEKIVDNVVDGPSIVDYEEGQVGGLIDCDVQANLVVILVEYPLVSN